jgi:hypothetical protein
VLMEPEIEIVSDAPTGRSRRKAAKKSTATGAEESTVTGKGAELDSAQPCVVVAPANEPVVRRLPDEAEPEVVQRLPDREVCELEVMRLPANPRLILAYCELDGVTQVVRVWVGINKNFRPRMRLKAQRGASENAPWKLVGRRPRLPGRW